jgi:hypothetical protein
MGSWLVLAAPAVQAFAVVEALFYSLGAGSMVTLLVTAWRQGDIHPGATLADNLGVSVRATCLSPQAPADLHGWLGDALAEMGWTLHRHRGQQLVFLTCGSWASWGERVTIRLEGLPEGGTLVDIHSRPRLSTTLIDYGKNQRNVDRLRQILAYTEEA